MQHSARRLVAELGPTSVGALDDDARRSKLEAAIRSAGWRELRVDDGSGVPLATVVEAAIVVEALGAGVADGACTGPLLAGDLARRAGVTVDSDVCVGYDPSLLEPYHVSDAEARGPIGSLPSAIVVDSTGATRALVLAERGDDYELATVALSPTDDGNVRGGSTDLTRRVLAIAGRDAEPLVGARTLDRSEIDRFIALGVALTCADLVGTMRGAIDVTVAYATDRRQYGVPVGSFQAVQHLLAEARCLLEGSISIAAYAAWAVDALDADAALEAARVAKVYCVRAARIVHETAIQVHGGIGNTWECIAHVFLRRALLSTQWFGDDGHHLGALQRTRLGVGHGLS